MTMSALPDPQSLDSLKVVAVTCTRGLPLLVQRQRLQLLADRLGLCVSGWVTFKRRRRGRLAEQLRGVLPADASFALIDRLADLGSPLEVLAAAAEAKSTGLSLVSAAPEEAWLGDAEALLPPLGSWLAIAAREQRSKAAKEALGRARARGRTIGRPRVVVDLDMALPLVGEVGVERAATKIGCGVSTLRRALRAHENRRLDAAVLGGAQ